MAGGWFHSCKLCCGSEVVLLIVSVAGVMVTCCVSQLCC